MEEHSESYEQDLLNMQDEEEAKQPSYKWVTILGILLQIGSVVGALILAIFCLQKGYKDYLFFDVEKKVLLPPKPYDGYCKILFWLGFTGGVLVIARESLQKAHPITKAIRTVLAASGLVITIFANAFFAASLYVNEGLGFQPTYDMIPTEIAPKDEVFLIVKNKSWQVVQVYYLAHYLDQDLAYWIDGYDINEGERSYEAFLNPDALLLEERQVRVWRSGDNDPREEFFYLSDFPEEILIRELFPDQK
ncbi:MAG: hypothetical protein J5546_09395 [Lachnospiraceae bacterium]|nr:hypothetical protein [Lachnospiraceae bacterium]